MNPSNGNNLCLTRVLKERRHLLHLNLLQIADRMRVTPESVGHWERGSRRMELNRVPRLASILQLDEQYLCRLALAEFHPAMYACLFGPEQPAEPSSTCTS